MLEEYHAKEIVFPGIVSLHISHLQDGQEKFNRGRLLNIGVNEALKVEKFDCFVFQDVDLLPEHSKNVYYCDENARHLAAAIDETRYQ